MKKTLVSALSAALVIGAASTTFAASNPFSDVPRDHWAYDAVTQLASDGVIEGYGDGTYRGERNITRYEMAQMVARAMAKGDMSVSDRALLDRLAAEFADELNNLGVRVSNLEKHADMVKWGGVLEYTYTNLRAKEDGVQNPRETDNNLLLRLEPAAEVNAHWSVHARLDAETKLNKDAGVEDGDKVTLARAWAEGDYENLNVKLGKMEFFPNENGLLFDNEFSGAAVTFGKDLKVTLMGGRFALAKASPLGEERDDMVRGSYLHNPSHDDTANFQGINLQYTGERAFVGAGFYRLQTEFFHNFDGANFTVPVPEINWYGRDKSDSAQIWSVNAGYRFDKNNLLWGAYARNTKADHLNDSFQIQYDYKGADPADRGSWGLYAAYRKYAPYTSLAPTDDAAQVMTKGWEVGTNYTVLKNVVATLKYYNGKGIITPDQINAKKLFGRVEFFF